jgi:hypothetical protein
MTDSGLQTERTILSWRRTALTAATATVVCGRSWVDTRSLFALVATVSVALAAIAAALGLWTRQRRYRSCAVDARPVRVLLPLWLSATVAAGGIAALLAR